MPPVTRALFIAPRLHPPTEQAFRVLYDTFMLLNRNKYSTCAKLIGINRLTWKKWEQTPPKEWWWSFVLYKILFDHRMALRAERHSEIRDETRQIITETLDLLPRDFQKEVGLWYSFENEYGNIEESDGMKDAMIGAIEADSRAYRLIIRECYRSPTASIKPKKMMKKYTISKTSMQRAARALGIKPDTRGFGIEKSTEWQLPPSWEAEE